MAHLLDQESKTTKDGSDVNTNVETTHWTAQRLWVKKVPESIVSLFISDFFRASTGVCGQICNSGKQAERATHSQLTA